MPFDIRFKDCAWQGNYYARKVAYSDAEPYYGTLEEMVQTIRKRATEFRTMHETGLVEFGINPIDAFELRTRDSHTASRFGFEKVQSNARRRERAQAMFSMDSVELGKSDWGNSIGLVRYSRFVNVVTLFEHSQDMKSLAERAEHLAQDLQLMKNAGVRIAFPDPFSGNRIYFETVSSHAAKDQPVNNSTIYELGVGRAV